jgi:hypothetical protein
LICLFSTFPFWFLSRYLKFLKEKVGSKYDREFLSQAMPY